MYIFLKKGVSLWINYLLYLSLAIFSLSILLYVGQDYLSKQSIKMDLYYSANILNDIFKKIDYLNDCYICSFNKTYNIPSATDIFLTSDLLTISLVYPKRYFFGMDIVNNTIQKNINPYIYIKNVYLSKDIFIVNMTLNISKYSLKNDNMHISLKNGRFKIEFIKNISDTKVIKKIVIYNNT